MSNSILSMSICKINTIGASIMCLLIGYLFGFMVFSMPKLPQKKYPVKIDVCYETKGYWYTDAIECDSVKGDTIYKDSLTIINKNIVNVTFK